MGLFSAFDDLQKITSTIKDIISEFHQAPEDKEKNALAAQTIANQLPLAQLAINNSEAQNRSWFVAGWRPAMMWLSGFFTIINILIAWSDQTFSLHIATFGAGLPENIIIGALTGTYMIARTFEKIKGVSR